MNIPGWSEEMMKSWTDAQQKYWSNLMEMGSAATAGNATVPNWAEGMEKWWSMATPQMPVQANELMSRVFEMGKVYTRLAENALATASGAESNNVLEGWMDAMEKGFKDWSEKGGTDFSAFGNGSQVIEGWQQVMDSLGMGAFKNLSEIESSLPGSAMWQEQLKKMLGMSGLSEHIPAHNQKMLEELSAAYQQAMKNYMEAFSGQGLESVQALRDRIAQLSSEGASISSLRELYDLWVDVSEEVYQKFAFSDEYQKVYGEMVNSFVALKGALDSVRDAQLQALRILTASDLDEVLKRQHEAERENAGLQNEVDELKAQVAEMKAEAAPAATPAPAVEEAAAEQPVKAAAKPEPKAKAPVKKPAKAAPSAEPAAKPEPAAAKKPAKSAPASKTKANVPQPAAAAKKTAKPAPSAKPEPAAEKKPVKSAPAAKAKDKAPQPEKAPAKKPDDLTRIKGLGPKMQEKLIDAGIQTFDQLAALSDDQAQELDSKLDARGRLIRDKWVAQAGELSGKLA
ncbi:MAG: poly(R)-hydroxyalkanoic acid synthase subunit PhaE [Thiolinea sp.]